MQSRSWLDLITNVIERCKMILECHQGGLQLSRWPKRAENEPIEPTAGSQPPQRKSKQWPPFEGARRFKHS